MRTVVCEPARRGRCAPSPLVSEIAVSVCVRFSRPGLGGWRAVIGNSELRDSWDMVRPRLGLGEGGVTSPYGEWGGLVGTELLEVEERQRGRMS